jgi:peptidoglycan hydrolase CwlO-like protein
VKDADGVKTAITGSFVESSDTPGLYFSPDIVVSEPGDYTIVINNSNAGMDNHATPVVVTEASIDDLNNAIAVVQATADDIKSEVDGLDGQNLQDIKDSLASIKNLINDEDGSAVDSVMEFVSKIDEALSNGANSLSVLSGYTDDVENMLLGTEHLADGSDNPLYGANNAQLKALIESSLVTLQGDLTNARNYLADKIDNFRTSVEAKVDAVKTVVDSNANILGDTAYGNEALKGLLDTLTSKLDTLAASTTLAEARDAILAVLNDSETGLSALKSYIASRFDTVDSNLATIENKIDDISNAYSFNVFA